MSNFEFLSKNFTSTNYLKRKLISKFPIQIFERFLEIFDDSKSYLTKVEFDIEVKINIAEKIYFKHKTKLCKSNFAWL